MTASMSSEARLASRRLPVVPLRQTLQLYLKSIVPFLKEDEARGGPSYDTELDKQVKLVRAFEHGIGSVLQKRLLGEFNFGFRLPTISDRQCSIQH